MVMSARHPKRVIPGATEQAAVRTERGATTRIARSDGRGARMSRHAVHEENTWGAEAPVGRRYCPRQSGNGGGPR